MPRLWVSRGDTLGPKVEPPRTVLQFLCTGWRREAPEQQFWYSVPVSSVPRKASVTQDRKEQDRQVALRCRQPSLTGEES